MNSLFATFCVFRGTKPAFPYGVPSVTRPAWPL